MKCCELYAGLLKQPVVIERPSMVDNDSGGQDIVWSTHKNWQAYLKPKSGSERVRGMQLESPVTHSIYGRYEADIKPTDRVNFNGRLFQIRAVLNVEERNRWLELICEEGVAQ